jgi:hypothetical protein
VSAFLPRPAPGERAGVRGHLGGATTRPRQDSPDTLMVSKNNRPPFGGCQALRAVHHVEGRSLAAFPAGRRQPGRPRISGRPSAEAESSELAPHRADREGKQAVPGPWPASRQSVPGRDRRFGPLPWSSLTGSVFQPTWVVSAMRSIRVQRFYCSNARRC